MGVERLTLLVLSSTCKWEKGKNTLAYITTALVTKNDDYGFSSSGFILILVFMFNFNSFCHIQGVE